MAARRLRHALALCALALAALPGAALAGTAEVRGGDRLVYTAADGESNDVTLRSDGTLAYDLVDDSGATPGTGCSRPDPADTDRVRCVLSRAGTLKLVLGDVPDVARIIDVPATVLGGTGNDTLRGGTEADRLFGEGGGDVLSAGRGRAADRLDGGSGEDFIRGSAGRNPITGGRGQDVISAGSGRDRISDRDSSVDSVRCGRGRDRATLDQFDFIPDRCERVRRGGPPVAAPVGVTTRGGDPFVLIGCPSDHSGPCSGRVRVTRRGRELADERYRLRAGARRAVEVKGLRPGSGVASVLIAVRTVLDGGDFATVSIREDVPRPAGD